VPTIAAKVGERLAGVYAATTGISMVNPKTNSLTYRGYPVQTLARACKGSVAIPMVTWDCGPKGSVAISVVTGCLVLPR
jgi:citrate synthase